MSIAEPDPPEIARRVRAARAYACISQSTLARSVGMSLATIKRIEGGERDVTESERRIIAAACGVPEAFMNPAEPPAVRLAVVLDEVQHLRNELAHRPVFTPLTLRKLVEARDAIAKAVEASDEADNNDEPPGVTPIRRRRRSR
jgi:transcriptional regulator with XRE-family HTH domain